MLASLKTKLKIIPINKYLYDKDIKKGVSYIIDKHKNGFYIEDLNIWLPEDKFNSLFILNES